VTTKIASSGADYLTFLSF